jgi:hypothetical protein
MVIQYLTLQDIPRLREKIDPDNKWYTDDELKKILALSAFQLNMTVSRCFLGIQQRARVQSDGQSIVWARNQLNRFEAGVLVI